MYQIKIELWKNNKYTVPDETCYVGKYLTKEAAQIDAQEIQQRIVYSFGYERSRLEIIEIEHAKYFNKEGD